MPLTVNYLFRDIDGKEATVQVFMPEGLSTSEIDEWIALLASRMKAISDCVIVRATVKFSLPLPTPIPAQPGSSAYTRTLLFFKDNAHTSRLSLPGRVGLPYDTDGAYAGIRITRDNVELFSLQGSVDGIVQTAYDGLGRRYPYAFLVGGSTRL